MVLNCPINAVVFLDYNYQNGVSNQNELTVYVSIITYFGELFDLPTRQPSQVGCRREGSVL
jgi:hypothetical protein